ncbi:MAG: hypothetical protein A2Z83_01460 [Omnitrophica bacterium GWA2_52_8]|nr:MAG: hypothetical protein A2Z83_01460 [Omnitrophica bacterium GWA2_52_8]
MRFTTKTEYGLVCLIYLAKHSELQPITVKELVRGEQFSPTFTEKIMQQLKAAKIVTSYQGNQGGYVLARNPAEVTLRDIIEALEGSTFEVFCEPTIRKDIVCTHYPMCEVSPVWYKTKELLDRFFNGISLEMLAKRDCNWKELPFSAA